MSRVVIIGGPSRGKSTEADLLHTKHGWPVFCGDPASTVRFQKPYTTYLPEGLPFAGDGGAADWISDNWFMMPGPWICEGHVMARALRRFITSMRIGTRTVQTKTGYEVYPQPLEPCDRIIVLDCPAHRETSKGQEAMHAGVMKVWREIAPWFRNITEVRHHAVPVG